MRLLGPFLTLLIAVYSSPVLAATVSFTDIIPDSSRDYFNGFEGHNGGAYLNNTYTENNIVVTQINPDGPNSMVSTYDPSGREGLKSWYANGGDNGYTKIALLNGATMQSIGFLSGHGNSGTRSAAYSLRLGSNEVGMGYFDNSKGFSYVGIFGVLFDEVWLVSRAGAVTANDYLPSFDFLNSNALALDSIEVSLSAVSEVPVPAALPLFGTGLAALGFLSWRRKRKAAA